MSRRQNPQAVSQAPGWTCAAHRKGAPVSVALDADGVVQGVRGLAGVEGTVLAAQACVEIVGDIGGHEVLDRPEGADDVGISGELEGCGEVDGLVEEPLVDSDGCVAGGQGGELGSGAVAALPRSASWREQWPGNRPRCWRA